MRRAGPILVILLALPAGAELPNEALICPAEAPELDKHRFLRALALDATGSVPTTEAVLAVEASDDVPEALVDELLSSEAFADRAVRRHMDLLWPNITNVTLTNTRAALTRTGDRYWIRARAAMYRGDDEPCLNEPAQWTADGAIATTPVTDPATGTFSQREGYVLVNPYWLTGDEAIKVCAFDAQDVLASQGGTSCGAREGQSDPGCGCGPELRWCRYGGTERQVSEAMAGDLIRRVRALIEEDRPYVELFTGNKAWVNGPLVFHLKHLAPMFASVRLEPLSVDPEKLPDLEFTDADQWVEITLGQEHAGILTSWAYLLRFQTERARANRFYNAFMCEPFSPPAGGIPFDDAEAVNEADLQKRAGCKYCHSLLEPSSSYWGRWGANGAGYLSPADYPPLRQDCLTCATSGVGCSTDCNLYYVTKALAPQQEAYLGKLLAYEFRRPEHEKNVEVGPRVLALSAVVDNRVPMCVARRTAEWLLGREIEPAEGAWLDGLANGFVANGYSYKGLVKEILMSSTYRRVR